MFRKSRMANGVTVLCIAALTALAGVAQAKELQGEREKCGQHQRHDFKKIAKKLGLSDAQKTQAKEIFTSNKETLKPLLANLRAEHKTLHELIHADTIDEAAIRAQTAKVAGIQADINVIRAKMAAQFRAILTPAQQANLKTLHQKKHKEHVDHLEDHFAE